MTVIASVTQLELPSWVDKKTSAFAIFLLIPIWYLLSGLWNLFFSSLRKVPGPILARFTRLWEVYHVWKGDLHLMYVDLHAKYGPVVRTGPNRYSVVRADDVAVIYALSSKFDKSPFFTAFTAPSHANLFTVGSNHVHAQKRRKIADLYSMTTVVAYEPQVDDMIALLVRKFTEFSNAKRTVSLPTMLLYFTFDVIGTVTINSPFGLLESEHDVQDIIDSIHSFLDYGAVTGLLSEFHRPIFNTLSLIGRQPRVMALFNFVLKQIEIHRADGKVGHGNRKAESFLSKSMDLVDSGKFDMNDVFDVCAGNIGAGSDTTTVAINAAIFHTYSTPHVLKALRKELDDAIANGRISNPITFKEAQGLPYLQAVVKEALRIHPPIGSQLSRVVPKGGAHLAGHFFPEGTEVGANGWAVHHGSHIFGDDAGEFKPERWLKTDQEGGNKLMFSFGAGARTCIGKNISLLELTKAIPQIVLNFDIRHESTQKTPDSRYSWVVFMDYYSKISPRAKSEE
ncbi:cytochrome protein [Leptodontidium sp. MPI-SDFR-AT-0119]|nr:cytochrome protein [Leptodontidium sp. MPI-SDFR-AT-0119]